MLSLAPAPVADGLSPQLHLSRLSGSVFLLSWTIEAPVLSRPRILLAAQEKRLASGSVVLPLGDGRVRVVVVFRHGGPGEVVATLSEDSPGGDTTARSLGCMARNGRLMLIGFASGIEAEDRPGVAPRALCFGNLSIGGVLLSYASDPAIARQRSGFNLVPRAVGEDIQRALEDLLAAGRIRPDIGRVVGFADVPAALDDMEDRKTIGRTVVEW